jgi:outer membrane receptor protein involved in Fe transport
LSSIKLGASYLFAKKLKVWTELYYYGKRYARKLYVFPYSYYKDEELPSFFDINLGADYAVSDKFSVFLSATNLLNNNYDRFYSYPVQGINVMAGVSLKF